jgi:CheY-like chemotaxis protein
MHQIETRALPARVLIVDDNVASGELLTEILSLEGFVVRVARCARDALAVAREFAPGIALLDIGLPDMDGFALARLFKSDAYLAPIRLIALSGYARPEAQRSDEGLFDRYLVKPADLDQLLSVLNGMRSGRSPAAT